MNFTITPKHLLTQLPCAGAWGRLRENSQEDLATPKGGGCGHLPAGWPLIHIPR